MPVLWSLKCTGQPGLVFIAPSYEYCFRTLCGKVIQLMIRLSKTLTSTFWHSSVTINQLPSTTVGMLAAWTVGMVAACSGGCNGDCCCSGFHEPVFVCEDQSSLTTPSQHLHCVKSFTTALYAAHWLWRQNFLARCVLQLGHCMMRMEYEGCQVPTTLEPTILSQHGYDNEALLNAR